MSVAFVHMIDMPGLDEADRPLPIGGRTCLGANIRGTLERTANPPGTFDRLARRLMEYAGRVRFQDNSNKDFLWREIAFVEVGAGRRIWCDAKLAFYCGFHPPPTRLPLRRIVVNRRAAVTMIPLWNEIAALG